MNMNKILNTNMDKEVAEVSSLKAAIEVIDHLIKALEELKNDLPKILALLHTT